MREKPSSHLVEEFGPFDVAGLLAQLQLLEKGDGARVAVGRALELAARVEGVALFAHSWNAALLLLGAHYPQLLLVLLGLSVREQLYKNTSYSKLFKASTILIYNSAGFYTGILER